MHSRPALMTGPCMWLQAWTHPSSRKSVPGADSRPAPGRRAAVSTGHEDTLAGANHREWSRPLSHASRDRGNDSPGGRLSPHHGLTWPETGLDSDHLRGPSRGLTVTQPQAWPSLHTLWAPRRAPTTHAARVCGTPAGRST